MLAIFLTIACSRYIYNGVILHAHPVHGESHNQCNTTGVVVTTSLPFHNEPHRSHVLCVKAANSARPPHPGHSTILLRSEIPSGMCPKLRTVAASKNRDHARNLSYYCLLGLQIWLCNSSCTSRSWWITQSTQHRQRGCNSSLVSSKHFSEILPPNGWYPEPGKVGQGGLKVLHLWRHSQKNRTPQAKIFFKCNLLDLLRFLRLLLGR